MAPRQWVMLSSGVIVAAAVALWFASGRESLTKASRTVTVQVRNEPFDDYITRDEFERGPIFGYFIGLDAVVAATAVALIAAGSAWLVPRLRDRRRAIETRRLT